MKVVTVGKDMPVWLEINVQYQAHALRKERLQQLIDESSLPQFLGGSLMFGQVLVVVCAYLSGGYSTETK